jgi:uncharacterized protein with GYD domain
MSYHCSLRRVASHKTPSMLAKPEDTEGVGLLFAKSGGKFLAYYTTFSEHDFLVVSEGPIEGAAVSTIVTAASGGVTDLKTILAMTTSDMENAFTKAGAVADRLERRRSTQLSRRGGARGMQDFVSLHQRETETDSHRSVCISPNLSIPWRERCGRDLVHNRSGQ